MPDDNVPTALRRDLRADTLTDDPLMPEVIRAAIGPDAVRDDVRVEIVGVLVRGQYVLVVLHPDCLEQAFCVAHDLFARWVLVLRIGDDEVINGITTTRRKCSDGFHLERGRFHRGYAS